MTTEQSGKRPISELLEMRTYQGMSDEEIDSLIEYHVSYAVHSEELNIRRNESDVRMAEWVRHSIATRAAIVDVIESGMRAIQPVAVEVATKTFVPNAVEVSNV